MRIQGGLKLSPWSWNLNPGRPQWVKNPHAVSGDAGDRVQSLGQEGPLEEGITTHSSILAWRVP